MADEPTAKDDTAPPSKFKPGADIVETSVGAMKALGPLYMDVGIAGFLAISGTIIAILTMVLSFLTGTEDQGKWYGGITVHEEAMFMGMAALFVALGVVFLLWTNSVRARIQRLTIEMEREQNRWIHEESMARLGAISSAPTTADTARHHEDGSAEDFELQDR